MENFNKNWLIILLIAAVFLILGFLLGRVTGQGHGHGMHGHPMEMGHGHGGMHMGGDGEHVTVKIDTVSDHGQKMKVTVEKKARK